MRSSIAVVVVFLLLRASSVEADPPPPDPNLAGLIEEAHAANPELAAAEHMARAALARPGQVSSGPGPTAGLFYQNDGVSPSLGREPMTMLGLMAGQVIAYPGKAGARRQVAESEGAAASAEVDRARLGVVGSVKRAYYGLLLARGLAELSQQHRDLWREIQEAARVRYAAAAGPQMELIRAQVEGTRLHAVHAQHHAEARARLAELNLLRGQPPSTPLETEARLGPPEAPRPADEWIDWFRAHSPELRAAVLSVERDERAVGLARLDFKPDFAVQGGIMYRGSLPPMWQASGTVMLASRGRARGALAEAESRLAADRSRLQAVQARIAAVVEQRLALLEAAEAIETTYREALLPQGQVAVDSAMARYTAGQGSQVGVLDAVAAILEDRIDHLRLLATHAIERSRLEEASLDPPIGIDTLLSHGRGGMPGNAMSGAMRRSPAAVGTTPDPAANPMSMR